SGPVTYAGTTTVTARLTAHPPGSGAARGTPTTGGRRAPARRWRPRWPRPTVPPGRRPGPPPRPDRGGGGAGRRPATPTRRGRRRPAARRAAPLRSRGGGRVRRAW